MGSVTWARVLLPLASVSSPVKWDGSDATWRSKRTDLWAAPARGLAHPEPGEGLLALFYLTPHVPSLLLTSPPSSSLPWIAACLCPFLQARSRLTVSSRALLGPSVLPRLWKGVVILDCLRGSSVITGSWPGSRRRSEGRRNHAVDFEDGGTCSPCEAGKGQETGAAPEPREGSPADRSRRWAPGLQTDTFVVIC